MRELSMHILDIAENSARAGASHIGIFVYVDLPSDRLTFIVEDDGKGIPPEILESLEDPFTTTRTERRVGLGIPLLAEACRRSEGDLEVCTQMGVGTRVTAWMRHSNIDRVPMGNLAQTVVTLVAGYPDRRITLEAASGSSQFNFDTEEAKALLDGVSITSPPVLVWLRDYLAEGLAKVEGLD